jgi:hypothetical protein
METDDQPIENSEQQQSEETKNKKRTRKIYEGLSQEEITSIKVAKAKRRKEKKKVLKENPPQQDEERPAKRPKKANKANKSKKNQKTDKSEITTQDSGAKRVQRDPDDRWNQIKIEMKATKEGKEAYDQIMNNLKGYDNRPINGLIATV